MVATHTTSAITYTEITYEYDTPCGDTTFY